MACYHPMVFYRSRSGRNPATGKWPLTASPQKGFTDMPVYVPCGKCIGCRLAKSREWAVRCVHEAACHRNNCFITLTFDEPSLAKIAPNGSLEKRTFQLFMKRLRKAVQLESGAKIRFFHCGEYGSKKRRPHHHAIIFGYDFPDKKFIRFRHGFPVFRSSLLEELWPYGMCEVGVFSFQSAAYIARYVVKKVNGEMAADHYGDKLPEYLTMSLRPGIGADWYERYRDQVFPNNFVVVKDGRKLPPPRYYRKLLEKENPALYQKVFGSPLVQAIRARDRGMPDYKELARQEAVKKLALEKLVRPLEGQHLGKVCDVVMELYVYSVFDDKTEAFGQPFFMTTSGAARRLFGDQILDDSHPSLLHDHPDDFSLYCVGVFHDGTGKIDPFDVPKLVATGVEFKNSDEKLARNLAPFVEK